MKLISPFYAAAIGDINIALSTFCPFLQGRILQNNLSSVWANCTLTIVMKRLSFAIDHQDLTPFYLKENFSKHQTRLWKRKASLIPFTGVQNLLSSFEKPLHVVVLLGIYGNLLFFNSPEAICFFLIEKEENLSIAALSCKHQANYQIMFEMGALTWENEHLPSGV